MQGTNLNLFASLILGLALVSSCDEQEGRVLESDGPPSHEQDAQDDGQSQNSNEFFRADLGEDAFVAFTRHESEQQYSDAPGFVSVLAVGGARLDELFEIPGVSDASEHELFVGLGGDIDLFPLANQENGGRGWNLDTFRFQKGELLERLRSVPFDRVDIEPKKYRKSSWCVSSREFKSKVRRRKSSQGRYWVKALRKETKIGVRARNQKLSSMVCNKETSSGTPSSRDLVEITWDIGWILGPTPDGKGGIQGPNQGRRSAILRDGYRAYYWVIFRHPSNIGVVTSVESEPYGRHRFYAAMFDE